jgi:hypothetical protein
LTTSTQLNTRISCLNLFQVTILWQGCWLHEFIDWYRCGKDPTDSQTLSLCFPRH